jgi:single-stranded-DNA-specific exonuclease
MWHTPKQKYDFIICDHHRPGEFYPMPLLFLTQNDDCTYPYDELCGCGIGFKLIQGWVATKTKPRFDSVFDLVSAAIAADIVPMTGENRVLAYFGLQVINSNPRPGIKAIIHQIKRKF